MFNFFKSKYRFKNYVVLGLGTVTVVKRGWF